MENNNEKDKLSIINYNKDCQIIQGDNLVVVPPSATVNVFQAPQGKSQNPSSKESGSTASNDQVDRDAVLDNICDLFQFPDNMLGYDNNKAKITNERLALLFCRCLGCRGAHPSGSMHTACEQLWEILVTKRLRCTKCAGEQYFRQTVLNIIGYFRRHELVVGQPSDIARVMFPNEKPVEYDTLRKLVASDITSSAFDGTKTLIDYYINQLKHGEF